MKSKIIDLGQTVYELCMKDPEIADILAELGFWDITKHGMLGTAGRFMTIPKGARMKDIQIDDIKAAFARRGYQVKEGLS